MIDLSAPVLDDTSNLPLDVPFTAAVARACGVPRHLLTLWCQLGLLRQPIRRVYVAAQVEDSLMLRAQCLSLATPQDAVITDRHAAWLLGAEMVLAPNEHLEVLPVSMYLPTGRRLRNGLSVSGERQLRPEDITEVMGLAVTTKLRTAWDLGRVRSRERAISGLDQMLRLPGFPIAFLPVSSGSRGSAGSPTCARSPHWQTVVPSHRRSPSFACTGSTPAFLGRCLSSRCGSRGS